MTRSLVLSLCAVLFFTVAAGWILLGGRMSARTAEGARQSAPVIYIHTPEELRAIGSSRESLNGRVCAGLRHCAVRRVETHRQPAAALYRLL